MPTIRGICGGEWGKPDGQITGIPNWWYATEQDEDDDAGSVYPRVGRWNMYKTGAAVLSTDWTGDVLTPTTDGCWLYIDTPIVDLTDNNSESLFISATFAASTNYYAYVFYRSGSTISINLYKLAVDASLNTTWTLLASPTARPYIVASGAMLRLAIWWSRTSPFPTKVYWNDEATPDINYAGQTGITVGSELAIYKKLITGGKGAANSLNVSFDNAFMANDDGGNPLSTGCVVLGFQPYNDVTGNSSWTMENSTKTKKYQTIDDENDTVDEANDRLAPPDTTSYNLSGFPDIGSVTVLAVRAIGVIPDVVTPFDRYRFVASDGDANYAPVRQAAFRNLTPGGAAWTPALLNTLQAGPRVSSTTYPMYGMMLEVLANTTRPAKNDGTVHGDEALAYVATRRRYGSVV